MTEVHLHFHRGPTGAFTEAVRADCLQPGIFELRAHSTFAPLGPGDIVTCAEEPAHLSTVGALEHDTAHRVTGIKHLESVHTVEVTLHVPAGATFGQVPTPDHPAMKAIAALEAEWSQAAPVTRNTGLSFLVSSPTRGWIMDNIAYHRFVEHVEWVREPTLRPALARWLDNPSF